MRENLVRSLMTTALLTILAVAATGQVNPTGDKQKIGPRKKTLEESKVSLALLEQEAAKRAWSSKKNGVELAIKAKGVPNEKFMDIEVAWTLTYTGPRSPLIIVQPTLTLTTAQTVITIYAVPNGKDYAFPFMVMSPMEIPGKKRLVMDAYGATKELPDIYNMRSEPFPQVQMMTLMLRTKDWFVKVPAAKTVQGVLTVSGAKLKACLLASFPGEFDPKRPPRLFVDMIHTPWDRGEDFNFDAWTGELYIPANAIPAIAKW